MKLPALLTAVLLLCGAAGALVSSAHVATGAPVAPHCEAVTRDGVLHVAEHMRLARDTHQAFVDYYDQNPGVEATLTADVVQGRSLVAGGFGSRTWHADWVTTYNETIGLIAVLTRGCF